MRRHSPVPYTPNLQNQVDEVQLAEENYCRDLLTLSQNSQRLLERKKKIENQMLDNSTGNTGHQSSHMQDNVNNNPSNNKPAGSLLDDFADTSTEMMDICGGDD